MPPEFPAWKAFVVQFARDAGEKGGPFSGRVEHLSSGRRTRFGSHEELLKALGEFLLQIGSESETED